MFKPFTLLTIVLICIILPSCEEKVEEPEQKEEQLSDTCQCVSIEKEFLKKWIPLKKEELAAHMDFELRNDGYTLLESESLFRRENQTLLEKIQVLERNSDSERKKCADLQKMIQNFDGELSGEYKECPESKELEDLLIGT